MWDGLPGDVQDAIVALVFAPDGCAYIKPNLLRHVPSRQFALHVWCVELKRRSRCYTRARELAQGAEPNVHKFVEAATRVGIDHTLLQRGGWFPIDHYVQLISRVRSICHFLFDRGKLLMLWTALGYSPSCFYRSVAAETILKSELLPRDWPKAIAFVDRVFEYLHYLGAVVAGDGTRVLLRIKEVLSKRLVVIEGERFNASQCGAKKSL